MGQRQRHRQHGLGVGSHAVKKFLIPVGLGLLVLLVIAANPRIGVREVALVTDLLWTNDGTAVRIAADTNRLRLFSTHAIFGPNTNRVMLTNGSIAAGDFLGAVNSYIYAEDGGIAGGTFNLATNSAITVEVSGIGSGEFNFSSNCVIAIGDSGLGSAMFLRARDCKALVGSGGIGGGDFTDAVNTDIEAFDGGITAGTFRQSSNCLFSTAGGFTGGNFVGAKGALCDSDGGAYVAADGLNSTNFFSDGLAAFIIAEARHSSNAILFGRSSIAVGILTNVNPVIKAIEGSLAIGIADGNERVYAEQNAFAFGRDIASTNNWTFGIHGTNSTPFSFALVNNGVQFQVASNGSIWSAGGLRTNVAQFDIVTTDFVINTWYTNDSRRATVSLSFELDSNATGTAKAGIYVDQALDGTFETTKTVSSAASSTDPVQQESTAWLNLGARFAITNLSTGVGTATVVVGSSQWVKQ